MNDIEKVIEDDFNDEELLEDEELEEEREEKPRKVHRDRDNKKLIYIVGAVVILILLGVIIFLLLNGKDNKKEDKEVKDDKEVKEETKEKDEEKDKTKKAYVSCTDNTSLLNVRKEPEKDIIDGLACFKQVTILEEKDKTDNCDKWYKISYEIADTTREGYVCSTYIKEDNTSDSTKKEVKELIGKANDYFENNILKSYCGHTDGTKKTIEYTKDNMTMTGEYVKSEYKTLEELKKYLLSFLDESLIKPKLELSDIDNKEYYDDYYEIEGNLYCRNYAGKGWRSLYTGNYNFKVDEDTDDKMVVSISYQYLNEESSCNIKDLSDCSSSNYNYRLGKINISKKDGNYIITKMDFHD